jgi:hypothetical protein
VWRVDGFKTKAEADAFKKANGWIVLWDKRTPTGRESTVAKDYRIATQATGIDREKYPFVVERRI